MLAKATSLGPGPYSVVLHPESSADDTGERYRIHDATNTPVLDVYRYDYMPKLAAAVPAMAQSSTTGKAADVLQRMKFFLRTLALLVTRFRRAKKPMAKWQIGLGVIATLCMAAAVLFAILALLAALGMIVLGTDNTSSKLEGAEGYSIGALLSALAVFLLTVIRPRVLTASNAIAQLITYAEDERRAVTVYTGLAEMVDTILEATPERKIHILGYSFGAVVAVDYLFPRKSMHDIVIDRDGNVDARMNQLETLSTVGCPLDMLRVYFPRYLDGRQARKTRLDWLNIFTAADVLSSNFADEDDIIEEVPREESVEGDAEETPHSHFEICGENRTSIRYTSHKLTLWKLLQGYGFIAHRHYWGEPGEANCLHLVARHIQLGSEGQ